jgi:hypothetical protein
MDAFIVRPHDVRLGLGIAGIGGAFRHGKPKQHRQPHGYAHSDPDGHTDYHGNRQPHGHAHSDPDGHAFSNAHRKPHGKPDDDGHAHGIPNRYPETYCHGYARDR